MSASTSWACSSACWQAARATFLVRPVIEGPAGIGKTRLLAELRRVTPRHGLRPLVARGSDLEREFPFGVVRQLFEPALGGPELRRRLLDEAAAPAESIFTTLTPAANDEGDVSFAALHGLYWLTVNLAAEEPLLLVVDDLHWCDRPSLRFLAYLSRRLEGLAAVMVVGLRTAEPGTDPVLIGEITAGPDVLHLTPGLLSPHPPRRQGGSVRSGKKNDPLSRLIATDDGGRGLRSGGHLRGA